MVKPLVPVDVDLRNSPFMPIDIERLFNSAFHARANDAEWRAGVTLWLKSFHQVPAASLPDDDVELARLAELGRDLKMWRKVRGMALHGWKKADDGRLYHPVVAEKALEAWLQKLGNQKSSITGNAKRWGAEVKTTAVDAQTEIAREWLAALNPQSRALRKRPPKPPNGSPNATAVGTPDWIPSGSQETGTGTKDKQSSSNGNGMTASRRRSTTTFDIDRLMEAAAGNVEDGTDIKPIQDLLDQGYDFELDILPGVRKVVPNVRDPLRTWRAGFVLKAIRQQCTERLSVSSVPPPSAAVSPETKRHVLLSIAVGCIRENGRWNATFGPHRGEPGCLIADEIWAEAERLVASERAALEARRRTEDE